MKFLVRSASIPEEPEIYLSKCANCTLNLKALQPCLERIDGCTRCTMYRNDQDPGKCQLTRFSYYICFYEFFFLIDVLEAGCCMSNCGPSYQISMADGRQTYFCQGDICNLKIPSEKIPLLR